MSSCCSTISRVERRKIKAKQFRMRLIKFAANIFYCLLMVAMAVIVYFLIQSKLMGTVPTVAGHQFYIVLSGSMSPTFETGSVVAVQPVAAESLTTGDVITFADSAGSGSYITHRVTEVLAGEELAFVTRGDANNVEDPSPVAAEQVVGKVSFAIPYAGYLLDFAQTQRGLLALIIIPGVLVIIFEVRNLLNYAALMEKESKQRRAPRLKGERLS